MSVRVEHPYGRDPIATYTFKYRSLSKSIIKIIMNVTKRKSTDHS